MNRSPIECRNEAASLGQPARGGLRTPIPVLMYRLALSESLPAVHHYINVPRVQFDPDALAPKLLRRDERRPDPANGS